MSRFSSPRSLAGLLAAVMLVPAAAATTASASDAPTQPELFVSVLDDPTGLRSATFGQAELGAWADPTRKLRITLVRGGVAQPGPPQSWRVVGPFLPGDVLRVADVTTGEVVGEAPIEPYPAVDEACVGARELHGRRAGRGGRYLEGGAAPPLVLDTGDVLRGVIEPHGDGTFTMRLPAPLPVGHLVSVTEQMFFGNVELALSRVVAVARDCEPPAGEPPVGPVAPVTPGPAATAPAPSSGTVAADAAGAAVAKLRGGGLAGIARRSAVRVAVPAGGTLTLTQYAAKAPAAVSAAAAARRGTLAATGRRTFGAAGTGTVQVRPTAKAARLVHGARRLTVRVRAVFRPAGGGRAVTAERTVTLKR